MGNEPWAQELLHGRGHQSTLPDQNEHGQQRRAWHVLLVKAGLKRWQRLGLLARGHHSAAGPRVAATGRQLCVH